MNMKTFAVERWMNTYENNAVYNRAETDDKPFTLCDLLSLGNKEKLIKELMQIKLGYNPTTGRHELRKVISSFYKDTTPENILVTTGAIEADFLVTNALIEQDDTVIVQFPPIRPFIPPLKLGEPMLNIGKWISMKDMSQI